MNVLTSTYSKDSLLVTDTEIFDMQIYDPLLVVYDRHTAYIEGNYYYLYRGVINKKETLNMKLKPGIYKIEEDGSTFLIHPTSDKDITTYTYADKVSSINTDNIISMINSKEAILITVPESSKSFLPPITNNDDILKRLIKQALLDKNIDIDHYKSRFESRNAIFNFKQILRSDNKLSMLLFDRGCEALNLKYTIIIEEVNPENYVGNKLNSNIVATSEDTYDL